MGKFTVDVSDQSFQDEVLNSAELVMVDFWAVWCMPCKAIAPILENIAEEYKGKVKFCKLNVDENPQMAAKYQIMSIPLLLMFKGGQQVDSILGAVPEHMFRPKVEALI